MSGMSSVTGGESILYADNLSFDGDERSGALNTNGQLWIGSTASPHVKRGSIVPNGSITIGYSSPNITIGLSGSGYYSLSPYIVGTDGNSQYPTISEAIAAAISDGASSSNPKNIYIKPKSSGYTENITLADGINLIGFGGMTKIIGKITASFASGEANINGLTLQTNSDFSLVVGGTAAITVNLFNCFLNVTNNTSLSYTNSNSSSKFNILSCRGDIATTGITYYSMSSNGNMGVTNCHLINTGLSTTAATNSDGTVTYRNCALNYCVTTSGSGNMNLDRSSIFMFTNTTAYTHTGTSSPGLCTNAKFVSGSAVAISVGAGAIVRMTDSSVDSTNTNAISGAGTLQFANVSFTNSSTTIATTTQQPLVNANNAIKVVTPGAYPYTVLPQDQLVLVDGSAARVINLSASPVSGQKHIIKDNSGSASGVNTITITPAAGNIDGAGTYVMNVAYGSATVIYNGTQWNVT